MSLEERVHLDSPGGQRRNVGLSLVTPVCDICGAVLADQKRHDEWHELHDDWSEPTADSYPSRLISPEDIGEEDRSVAAETADHDIILPLPEDAIARMYGKATSFMEKIWLRAKNETWPDTTMTEIVNVQRVLKLQEPHFDQRNFDDVPPLAND